MVRARAVAATLASLLLFAGALPARADGVARLLLVIGNNRPDNASQARLRYADDDAIRYYERFEGLAEDRILLTRLDEQSRASAALYPDISPPTRATVARAAAALRARASALRAQGRFVELVFVFAGHGGVRDGRPYLALEDGRLGPADLESLILAGDPADIVHVLIDACGAAGFGERRGPMRGERDALAQDSLPFGRLVARYPRAGFVVAASTTGAAFEWSRFGGGVASHLLRSALSGAADLAPPDGRVTYDEVAAFLRTATEGIIPSEFQQEIRVIAPRALPSASIVDLVGDERTTELLLDRPGRFFVRDADGHRIVDVHSGRRTVRLLLPGYSRRFELVEVRDHGEGCAGAGRRRSADCAREVLPREVAAGGRQLVSQLATSESTVATRGIVEDTVFEELLSTPYEGRRLVVDEPPSSLRTDVERPPRASIGVGYRSAVGQTVAHAGIMHGVELRMDLPLGRRFFVSPLLAAVRGYATTHDGLDYPMYEVDAGVSASWLALRAPFALEVGLEARWQELDQVHPYKGERFGWFVSGGPVARAFVPVTSVLDVGVVLSGGARTGEVDDELRIEPWAALHLGARVAL